MLVTKSNSLSHVLRGANAWVTASKHINDEEHIFAMPLILVLALLFCSSLAVEELGGVKQKKIRPGHTIWKGLAINEKKKKK